MPFGVDFRRHINEAVSESDALLALIGDRWEGVSPDGERRLDDPADFVRMEIETALHRGILVVPLLIGRVSMPSTTGLPLSLADLAYRQIAPVTMYTTDSKTTAAAEHMPTRRSVVVHMLTLLQAFTRSKTTE